MGTEGGNGRAWGGEGLIKAQGARGHMGVGHTVRRTSRSRCHLHSMPPRSHRVPIPDRSQALSESPPPVRAAAPLSRKGFMSGDALSLFSRPVVTSDCDAKMHAGAAVPMNKMSMTRRYRLRILPLWLRCAMRSRREVRSLVFFPSPRCKSPRLPSLP